MKSENYDAFMVQQAKKAEKTEICQVRSELFFCFWRKKILLGKYYEFKKHNKKRQN